MAVATDAAVATAVAVEYQSQVTEVGQALALTLARLWRSSGAGAKRGPLDRVSRLFGADVGPRAAAFAGVIPEAVAAFTAAQLVVAEMADAYTEMVLAAQGAAPVAAGLVVPEMFAGQAATGLSLESLLLLPAQRADRAVGSGLDPRTADTRVVGHLQMYATTETADAGRLSTATAGVARQVGGYVRGLRPPSCSRCAILAGRWYRFSAGFRRHPRCDCVNTPAEQGTSSDLVYNAREAILSGQVTGLSKAELAAIRLGADPSQVVNARDGMFTAGGRQYTTTGTTRRGVAGARLIAQAIARAEGAAPGATYRNMTMPRSVIAAHQAKYESLFRQGKTFERRAPLGGSQTVAYRYTKAPRASVAEILASSTSVTDARRVLMNQGYIL